MLMVWKMKINTKGFPRIHTPPILRKDLTSDWELIIRSSHKIFASFVYFDGTQWVIRIFGLHFTPSNSGVSVGKKTKRSRDASPAVLSGIYEVYREYEDGRRFKSWRIKPIFFGVSFIEGDEIPEHIIKEKRFLTNKYWICKYGYIKVIDYKTDPAISYEMASSFRREYDPLERIKLYKKYPLCRHLLNKGERSIAFDKTILRRLTGEKLMKFKNWWKQSEDSGYFFRKPYYYKDIKRFCLDNWLTQRDLFYEELSKSCSDRRIINYLFRQRVPSTYLYNDYIKLLTDLDYAITPSLRFPKDLRVAHDRLNSAENHKQLYLRAIKRNKVVLNAMPPAKILEEYGVKIAPLTDAFDFLSLGEYLGHCYKSIDNYYNSVAAGSSYMFSISNVITGEPLSVVEYRVSSDSIAQNKMIRNRDATDELYKIARLYCDSVIKPITA